MLESLGKLKEERSQISTFLTQEGREASAVPTIYDGSPRLRRSALEVIVAVSWPPNSVSGFRDLTVTLISTLWTEAATTGDMAVDEF